MKKLVLLLIIPLLFQCAKKEVLDSLAEEKCYLTKIDDPYNYQSKVFERDDQNRLSKVLYFYHGRKNSYDIYNYSGTDLLRIETYGMLNDSTIDSTTFILNYYRDFTKEVYGYSVMEYHLDISGTVINTYKKGYEIGQDGKYQKEIRFAYDGKKKE